MVGFIDRQPGLPPMMRFGVRAAAVAAAVGGAIGCAADQQGVVPGGVQGGPGTTEAPATQFEPEVQTPSDPEGVFVIECTSPGDLADDMIDGQLNGLQIYDVLTYNELNCPSADPRPYNEEVFTEVQNRVLEQAQGQSADLLSSMGEMAIFSGQNDTQRLEEAARLCTQMIYDPSVSPLVVRGDVASRKNVTNEAATDAVRAIAPLCGPDSEMPVSDPAEWRLVLDSAA